MLPAVTHDQDILSVNTQTGDLEVVGELPFASAASAGLRDGTITWYVESTGNDDRLAYYDHSTDTSTIGKPASTPRSIASLIPFLIGVMYSCGMTPPLMLLMNSKPWVKSGGLMLMLPI